MSVSIDNESIFRGERVTIPFRYVVLFGAFSVSAVLPAAISYSIQLLLLIIAFADWYTRSSVRKAPIVAAVAATIVFYWFLLMLHPNVPKLEVGILGFRKSALAVTGIILGSSVPERYRDRFALLLVCCLGLAVVLSVCGHLLFPDVLRSLRNTNDADVYTSMFRGQIRMQGVFAGPFHAAMAGGFLVCWSLAYWRRYNWLPKALLLLGLVAIYLTLVRTAYVALGGVVIAFAFFSSGLKSKARFTGALVLIASAGVAVQSWLGVNFIDIATTIGDAANDNRFLNRFNDYSFAWRAFEASPVFGWGAGAAGDVLGPAFQGGLHVTSHNLALKVLVEGGIIGLALWALLLLACLLSADRGLPVGKFGLSSLLFMLLMGLTGSSIEALPVTFFIFVAVGLGLRDSDSKLLALESPRADLRP